MLAPLLLAAAVALASPVPSAAPRAAAPADPCDGIRVLPADAACGDGPLCAARDRVQLACQVRDAMEKRYVFLGVKGRLLSGAAPGFEARAHLDDCVAAERAIAREDDPLRFYDRMRQCLAAFRDGHLMVGAPAR